MPKRRDKGREGKDKGQDGKDTPKKSPPPAGGTATSPSGEGGFQPLTSLIVPDPIPEEPESSLRSQRSVSDASALTRKSGRPSVSRSEHEMELVEVTDGATGGASGGDKEEKKGRKWHRPSVVKKLYPKEKDRKRPGSTSSGSDSQHVPEDPSWVESASDWPPETIVEEQQAEIDRLQAELRRVTEEKQTLEADVKEREEQQAEVERLQADLKTLADEKERLERKKNGDIKEVEGRCKALIDGRAGEFRRKDDKIKCQDDEIKRLQGEIEGLNSIKQSDEATRQKLRDMMQKEKTTQHELARVTEDLQAASQREQGLQHDLSHLQVLHQEAIEGLNREHQTQLQQQEKELTQQITEKQTADSEGKIRELEGERDRLSEQLAEVRQERDSMREKVRDVEERDRQLESLEQERDRVKEELAKRCLDIQAVQLEKDEVEKALQDAKDQLTKADEESETLKQQMEQQAKERNHLTAELETKVQQLEQELKEKEDTIVALQDEQQQSPPPQLIPPLVDQSAGDALKKLETKCCLLESENQKLRAQVGKPIPSNVHHFCLQLSKLVDPEGESAETTSRPFVIQDVIPLLQGMGCGVEFKPKGYVIALFHAFNQSQSILLDYTRIGEVVQLKGPGDHLDTSDTGEEVEKSPYSSLNEVKVAVTEGNMTDADKLELEQMLRESQDELEKLRVKNKNLGDHLAESQEQLEELRIARENLMVSQERLQAQNKNLTERVAELSAPKPAGGVQPSGQEAKAFKDLKAKYLQVVDEKLQLLAERDQLLGEKKQLPEIETELKQLHLPERPSISHPEVERSLSTGDLSPEDPKAEIRKLRKVIEEKDVEIDNFKVQLRSFEAVASGNKSLGEQNARLKDKLKAAQAEIKALSDQSKLTHVYNSLRAEVVRTREDLSKSEERAQDAEAEKDILQNEISAERDNNQKFESEVARLTLALHFYETKYPQGDIEGLCGLEDGAMKPEKDDEIVKQLKAEITELQADIRQKEATIMSLTKSRRTVESRYLRIQEEKDRLAEQIVTLIAVRDNLKGDTFKVKEYASQLVLAKETEAEGWKQEKEKMIKEIQDLQDDLGARRQEITILRKDFEERLKVDESDKAKKWRTQEQRYREQLQNFDHQLKQLKRDSEQRVKGLTHEFEQRELRLTIKLDQKVEELQRVTDNAIERQREFDAICDQLRQERDNVQTERDRYKDERDTWCTEYNKGLTMYEEKRTQHKAEVDKINEEMDLWKAKCATFDHHVREMEAKALKKEKECELTASSTRQLSSQVQELARQLNTEKQEKEKLSAKLNALDHQYRLERETWLTDKSNMDRAISSMTQQVQELQRVQSQTDILRGRVQGERKRVQQLERELQSAQELLQKMEEEHKSETEYTKAKCDDERLELERKLTPLKRELELLRTQTFADTKFAETYRRMDVERKELREEKEGLREELQTITAKYHAMVDDYTAAREVMLQSDLRLPKRNVDAQYGSQTQPAQLPHPHTPRTPEEYHVRPYQPPFHHLGEDRPPVRDDVPQSCPEVRQSVRTQPSENFENRPQDNQQNYNQKMVRKSHLEKRGSADYGLKQQSHPILNRQVQQQLQEHAYRQNQQPRALLQGMQPGQQQYPQQPVSQPIQQPMIPQQPAVRQPGIQHGQQPVIPQQPAVRQAGLQHGQQPAMQHTHQPGIRAQHGQQPVIQHGAMQSGQQPGIQHGAIQPGQQPGIQHGAMQPGQQPGMQHGAMQPGQQPDAQQMGGANPNVHFYNPQQNLPMTNAPSQPYQQGSPPRSQHPRSPKPGAPVNIPQSHDPAVSRAAGGQQQPGVYPAPNPQTPQSKRPLNPLTPQENVLLQSIETDISEAAAEVRSEVFTSMSSVESTPGGDEPMSLPQDPNLVCPMCKRQFKIGQIQSYRAHVDTCTG